mmetsp:Transcript_112803/g.364167  ORF Transcript_112803/g.364167 Transcript_112803/m.364167 type:complete len:497 (+) Transcript_112803:53-1543(+)
MPALSSCRRLATACLFLAGPALAAEGYGRPGLDVTEDTCEAPGVSLVQTASSGVRAAARTPPANSPPANFWSGKNGDVLRTGASTFSAPHNFSAGPSWVFREEANGVVRAAPLIDADRNIYISTVPGRVYKFSPSGQQLWKFPGLGRGQRFEIPGVPTLQSGVLYASTAGGTVLALSMATGELLWQVKVTACSSGDTWSMTAAPGLVIVPVADMPLCAYNSRIVALDVAEGRVRWEYKPDTIVYNLLAAVVDDTLVFSDKSGRTYRLDLATGREIWKFTNGTNLIDMSTGGAVVGPNGVVYVTSNVGNYNSVQAGVGNGRLNALSLATGERLWHQDVEFQANNAAAVGALQPGGPLSVVIAIGENPDMPPMRPGLKKGKVIAFDAETGARKDWAFSPPVWHHNAAAGDTLFHVCLPDAFSNPAIGGDGTVYIGFEDGGFYAIRDADGDGFISEGEASKFDTGAAFQGSPGLAPGLVVGAPCDGLRAFLAPAAQPAA